MVRDCYAALLVSDLALLLEGLLNNGRKWEEFVCFANCRWLVCSHCFILLATLVAPWVFFEGLLPLKLMFPCPVLSQHCSLQVFCHPSLELADGTNGPANMYFGSA